MATTVARLQAVLGADTRGFDRAMDQSETRMQRTSRAAGIAGAAIVGGLAYGLTKSVGAAREAQVAQVTLEQALTSAGISVRAHTKAIDANIQKTSKLAALDDEDLSASFAKLIRTTKDVTKATDGMNLAADIARARHISLEASTKMVERAFAGSDRAFSRIGISLPKVSDAYDALRARVKDLQEQTHGATKAQRAAIEAQIDQVKAGYDAAKVADKQASAQNAIAEAQKRFAGAAEDYGKTGAAANERLQVAVENLEESMGKALVPTLTTVSNAIAKGASWMGEHEKATKILIGAVAGLGATLIAVSVATKVVTAAQAIAKAATAAWTAAQWLLNAALTANPIGVVVVAIAALGAAMVVAYQKSETFRAVVTGAFNAVKAAMGFVQDALVWLRDKGGAAMEVAWKAIDAVTTPWQLEFKALKAVAEGIGDALRWLRDKGGEAVGQFWKVMQKPLRAITDAFEALKAPIKWIIDAFKWLLDKGGDIAGIIGKIGGVVGHIPGLGGTGPFNASSVIPPGDVGPTGMGAVGVGGGGPASLIPSLWDEWQMAHQMIPSYMNLGDYNPASVLPSGAPSDHAVYPAKAFDAGFSPAIGWAHPDARRFFMAMVGRPGIHYAILGDKIWSAEQGLHGYGYGGHENHVHVSSYDRGGWLQPGWTMAYNGTGRPERVGAGGVTVNVYPQGSVIAERDLEETIRVSLIRELQKGRGLGSG